MATSAFATGAYGAVQNLMATRGAGSQAGQAPGLGGIGAPGGKSDFASMLSGLVEGVVESGHKAETQAVQAASGKGDLVNVVTAVAESETALQTLVAVRDRVISAYEEIMRMPI